LLFLIISSIKKYGKWKLLSIIKETLTQYFRPMVFFYQTTSPGPLIHRLKTFRIWLSNICVQPTLSNIFANDPKHCFLRKSDSAAHSTVMSLTQLCHTQRFQEHLCDLHGGVNDTAVQIWHYCDFGPHIREVFFAEIWLGCTRHSGVIDTAVPGDLLFDRLRLTLREYLSKTYKGKLSYTTCGYNSYGFGYSSVIDTAVTKIGDLLVDFLRAFEAMCKKALTLVPGVYWGSCWMKKPVVKNLASESLYENNIYLYCTR
jgi:hypothetical protein